MTLICNLALQVPVLACQTRSGSWPRHDVTSGPKILNRPFDLIFSSFTKVGQNLTYHLVAVRNLSKNSTITRTKLDKMWEFVPDYAWKSSDMCDFDSCLSGGGADGEDEVRGLCKDWEPTEPALSRGGAAGAAAQPAAQAQVRGLRAYGACPV